MTSAASSAVQWAAKAIILAIATILVLQNKLSPEGAAVFSAAMLSLGITNGATLMAAKSNLGAVLHQVLSTLPPSVTITTIPPPPPPAPPAAPASVVLAAGSGMVLAIAGCMLGASSACQPPAMTPEDHAITSTEFDEQRQCIDKNKGNPRATDTCRAAVRARWDAWWRVEFDGGHE